MKDELAEELNKLQQELGGEILTLLNDKMIKLIDFDPNPEDFCALAVAALSYNLVAIVDSCGGNVDQIPELMKEAIVDFKLP